MNVDYKIYTEILIQRLVKALDQTVSDYQYAFLLDRLIDNNVRTVQAIISAYAPFKPKRGQTRPLIKGLGIAILFLN